MFSFECSQKDTKKFLAAMRTGGTPVPIPNTTVKTCTADGTMLATAWESRWLPEFFKIISDQVTTVVVTLWLIIKSVRIVH